MSRYRYLFSPLQLGPVTVRNRVVFSAHLTNYAADGLPTEQHAAYYAARAAGGAGLNITEEHSTHPTDWPYEKLIHGFHRDVIPGYKRITDAVHRYGTPIFAQINHNGGQASSMYSRLPVWAPSPVADPLFREVPKAVTTGEIAEIIAGYALVAAHCAEGGFDGVELQCSHSSIVRGFLSGATNLRTDPYGGSLEGVNYAMGAGIAAGESAHEALTRNDTSAESLSTYQHRLDSSWVLQDHKKVRKTGHFLLSERVQDRYPKVACDLFEQLYTVQNPSRKRGAVTIRRPLLKHHGLKLRALARDARDALSIFG